MKSSQIEEIRAFNRFYTNIIGLLNQHILDSRYSLPEVRVMFEIYYNSNISASDIISQLGIDKGYLSKILKQFEKRNLIKKENSKKDKRTVHLELSEQGKAEFEILNKASARQISEIFKNCSDEELKDLIGKMKSIKNLLTAKIK